MSYTLTIAGSAITLANYNATVDRCVPIQKGGLQELHFSRILPALTTLPDVWSGQSASLSVSGTTIFTGQVQGYVDRYMVGGGGWVREYRALGLRNSADYVPNTDATTFTDTSTFNLPASDPNFVGSKAGLTVGQIVTEVLTMVTNATNLNSYGVGAYTSLSPPTLPSLTTSDLSALTVIPQTPVRIAGERILQAIESFVQQWQPNQWLHVQPDGTIRFLDMRNCTNNTLTLGSDPRLDMPQLTRDFSDCYSQVVVRGNTLATPAILQTLPWPGSSSSNGGLYEDFAWGSLTSAEAKAEWVPNDFNSPVLNGQSQDQGTCTCPNTLQVTVTSSNTATTWPANYWGQSSSEAGGVVWVWADILGSSVSQIFSAPIVSNTALTAGGSSTLTLGLAMPNTSFNAYQIWGLAEGESIVYRKYGVQNSAIASAMLNSFPYPVNIVGVPGQVGAGVTSTPQGFYQYSEASGGGGPYALGTQQISVDPVNGVVWFARPTAIQAGTTVTAPYNVIVFLAVGTGALSVTAPSGGGYSGTLYTVEGVERIKTITVPEWTDNSNSSNMQTFANEFLASVENVVVEGTITYHGLNTTFLTCGTNGQGISVTGSTYSTGWDSLNLPVVGVELVFNNGTAGTSYDMLIHVSNRRGRYTADNFLRPGITHLNLGTDGGSVFTGGQAQISGYAAAANAMSLDTTMSAASAQAWTGAGEAEGWNASPISTNPADYS